MKKLRFLVLAIAAVAMVGLISCKSTPKEETSTEAVEEVTEEVASTDTTVVEAPADSVATEEPAAAE